jgi:hypothetical protein
MRANDHLIFRRFTPHTTIDIIEYVLYILVFNICFISTLSLCTEYMTVHDEIVAITKKKYRLLLILGIHMLDCLFDLILYRYLSILTVNNLLLSVTDQTKQVHTFYRLSRRKKYTPSSITGISISLIDLVARAG